MTSDTTPTWKVIAESSLLVGLLVFVVWFRVNIDRLTPIKDAERTEQLQAQR